MTATAKTFGNTGIGYKFREGAESMKAGKYVVTDPCYFLGHDDPFWDDFCTFMFGGSEDRSDSHTIEVAGYKVFTWGTAYGDGCYPTKKDGCEIGSSGVDAGMLALVPVELFNLLKEHLGENSDGSAPTIEMKHQFTPTVDEGNCSYGSYETITGDEEEDQVCDCCGYSFSYLNWNDICDDCQQDQDEEETEAEEEEERRREKEENEDE